MIFYSNSDFYYGIWYHNFYQQNCCIFLFSPSVQSIEFLKKYIISSFIVILTLKPQICFMRSIWLCNRPAYSRIFLWHVGWKFKIQIICSPSWTVSVVNLFSSLSFANYLFFIVPYSCQCHASKSTVEFFCL